MIEEESYIEANETKASIHSQPGSEINSLVEEYEKIMSESSGRAEQ